MSPEATPPDPELTDMRAVERELADTLGAMVGETDLRQLSLLRRDATYLALDLGDLQAAMTHAVTCLDLARAAGDGGLMARAHVAVALVMLDVYDDLGADQHFQEADALARAAGEVRDVALVAVNASHYELERGRNGAVTARLLELLDSPFRAGLDSTSPAAPPLSVAFHINFVRGASLALRTGELPEGLAAQARAQLPDSVRALRAMQAEPQRVAAQRLYPEVLEALVAWELLGGRAAEAQRLATERVRTARASGSQQALGRALLDRARVSAFSRDWRRMERDAASAVEAFERAGRELLAAQARQVQADALGRQNHFRQAFEVQRDLTRRLEELYREYFQQGALLRQIERQVSEAEVRAEAFAEAALRDPLTGAPNRAAAMAHLENLLQRAASGHPAAAALLDLDHFKAVNDRYGHVVGDAVLVRAVQVLTREIREHDCLARFGGEEFLLLLSGTPFDVARRICDRLCRTLAAHDWSDIHPDLRVTASFGLARLAPGRDPTRTLQAADQALYAAKAAGRNTVREAPDGS
ncbi:GGDEF domain-containing protein [Deinococcus depolymerans]|uniref:GGDEF domain-containing protein n=1 Tax=Deinococcus depolymerans TaxID=392408 RepID=A0ABP3LML0_9DEIO